MSYLQFLFTLRKLTRAGWKTCPHTTPIRLANPMRQYYDYCPLTAAARYVTGTTYGVNAWGHAARALKLNSRTIPPSAIVHAADDNWPTAERVEQQIRSHLLYFLGLPTKGKEV